MRRISTRVRNRIDANPEYKGCMLRAYKGHVCGGRKNTREHALIFAGRQVDEVWAIISCCAAGQEVDRFQDAHTMDKSLNKWVALNRATDEELKAYSKAIDLIRERARLNAIYGEYVPFVGIEELGINYPEIIYHE